MITLALRPIRWQAKITYRTDAGDDTRVAEFQEFCDLDDIVWDGPDWRLITDFRIELLTPPGQMAPVAPAEDGRVG